MFRSYHVLPFWSCFAKAFGDCYCCRTSWLNETTSTKAGAAAGSANAWTSERAHAYLDTFPVRNHSDPILDLQRETGYRQKQAMRLEVSTTTDKRRTLSIEADLTSIRSGIGDLTTPTIAVWLDPSEVFSSHCGFHFLPAQSMSVSLRLSDRRFRLLSTAITTRNRTTAATISSICIEANNGNTTTVPALNYYTRVNREMLLHG